MNQLVLPLDRKADAFNRKQQVRRAEYLRLLASIEEGHWIVEYVQRFLARDGDLTENDWDGWQRYGVDFEEANLPVEEEIEALRADPSAWSPVFDGWLGAPKGALCRNRLTEAERDLTERLLTELEYDLKAMQDHARTLSRSAT